MSIREDFDYTFFDPSGAMLSLESRLDQSLSLLVASASGRAAVIRPTREQWHEFRATLNHILDGDDVTASSTVTAKETPPSIWKDALRTQQLYAETLAKQACATAPISLDQEISFEASRFPKS